jgi:hypothetical protein
MSAFIKFGIATVLGMSACCAFSASTRNSDAANGEGQQGATPSKDSRKEEARKGAAVSVPLNQQLIIVPVERQKEGGPQFALRVVENWPDVVIVALENHSDQILYAPYHVPFARNTGPSVLSNEAILRGTEVTYRMGVWDPVRRVWNDVGSAQHGFNGFNALEPHTALHFAVHHPKLVQHYRLGVSVTSSADIAAELQVNPERSTEQRRRTEGLLQTVWSDPISITAE